MNSSSADTKTGPGPNRTTVHPTRHPALRSAEQPTLGRALRRTVTSELVKLRTLRSQVWLLVTAMLFMLALGPIQALGQVLSESQPAGSPGEATTAPVHTAAEAVTLALAGTSPATLLLGVMGVLLVTGEYLPRAVRTTFMLVPRRGLVVAAKALAGGLVVGVVGVFAVGVAVTASLVLLAQADVHAGWGSPEVLRMAAATVWYLIGWVVLGQAAGWVTRSKIGGAALLLVGMLLLAPVVSLVPGRLGEVLVAVLPSSVGSAMVGPHVDGALIGPGVAVALWSVYLVGFTLVAVWVTARRDA